MWTTLLSLGGRLASAILSAVITLSRKRVSVGSVAIALALVVGAWQFYKATHKQEEPVGWTTHPNDSTTAIVASPSVHDLPALTDAARTLHGKVVAGVSIKTKPDTIFVPTKEVIPSTVLPDSTREATLQQDTAGYRIRITAIAPPFPQPLKIGYSFITPAFTPEVGFIRTGSSYAAVVSWGGKHLTIPNAVFLPDERRIPSWALTGQVGAESDVGGERVITPAVALQLSYLRESGLGVAATGTVTQGHNQLQLMLVRRFWSR